MGVQLLLSFEVCAGVWAIFGELMVFQRRFFPSLALMPCSTLRFQDPIAMLPGPKYNTLFEEGILTLTLTLREVLTVIYDMERRVDSIQNSIGAPERVS